MRALIMRSLFLVAAVGASQGAGAATKLSDGAPSHPLMAPGYAVEYLLGVVLVMIALGVFALLLRRFQGRVGGVQDGLRIRASLPLGGKERLVVVQVQEQSLLLGVSPGCVQLVSKLTTPVDNDERVSANNTWLSRTLGKTAASHRSGGARQ